jgi:hypothetical protein
MLYDTSRAGNLSNEWFEPRYWQSRGELQGAARGRGAAYFVKHDTKNWVLRHTGAAVSWRSSCAIATAGATRESTRPFAEWQLTYRLHRAGLPVPARQSRRATATGVPATPATSSPSACPRSARSPRPARRRNLDRHLILDRPLHPPLPRPRSVMGPQRTQRAAERRERLPIDFDRCRPRRAGLWCDGNLAACGASLEGQLGTAPERFTESDWHGLLDGYRQSSARPNCRLASARAALALSLSSRRLPRRSADVLRCCGAGCGTVPTGTTLASALFRPPPQQPAACGCTRYRSARYCGVQRW